MEVKDPEIKLFGKKIAFPAIPAGAGDDYSSDSGGPGAVYNGDNGCGSDSEPEKVSHRAEESEAEDERETQKQDLANKDFSSGPDENSTMDEDSPTKQSQKSEIDQGDSTNQQQKLKKPDKLLPCPRCNSMDTKFCYYNNYNVNQPRHFCKSCQRYWTAGGTMRNVPVGAGRRKNKNSVSHCRHITISEALQAARFDPSNGFQHLNFKHNGTVLSFGSGSPLCDSMASVLHLSEKKSLSGSQNGFDKLDPKSLASCKGAENADDSSSGSSSITTSNSAAEGAKIGLQLQEPAVQQMNGFPSPVPCLPGVPWPYSFNPTVPLPAVYPSAFPLPFFPAPYWNCGVPGAYVPWVPPVVPTGIQNIPVSGTNLPILGKHPRDEDEFAKTDNSEKNKFLQEQNRENSVLVPKILRIGDPDEAAKSSIWTTLGINYDSVSREGLFKALQPKAGKKEQHVDANSPVLQANPAALSRHVTFQERA